MSDELVHPEATRPPPLEVDEPLRVILVGRTGLDAALRLDPGVELLRVETPMDAIGELSQPIDAESPAHATVIIGNDVELGPYAGDFVEGLQLLDPVVRVLGSDDRFASELHGVIHADASSEVVRRLVRGLTDEVRPNPSRPKLERTEARAETNGRQSGTLVDALLQDLGTAPEEGLQVRERPRTRDRADSEHRQRPAPIERQDAPDAQSAPAPRAPAPSRSAEPPRREPSRRSQPSPPTTQARRDDESIELDEVRLLRILLRGGDPIGELLELIRRRTGAQDLVFVPGEDHFGTRVEYNGRLYGHLRSERLGVDEMDTQARRLAHWLAMRDQQERLRVAAFTDELTGAYNRRYFTKFLDAAIERAQASRESLTLLAFDIDDFKHYNDRYGHSAGDEILHEIVRLLQSVIRPTDRVCRTGGDEFVVVFHEPQGPREPGSRPPSSVFEIAKRFQRQICAHRFPKLLDEAPGTLTISGGLATYPWDGQTADALLERADQLALESKRQGKNAVTLGPGAQRVCGMWDD